MIARYLLDHVNGVLDSIWLKDRLALRNMLLLFTLSGRMLTWCKAYSS